MNCLPLALIFDYSKKVLQNFEKKCEESKRYEQFNCLGKCPPFDREVVLSYEVHRFLHKKKRI